MAFNSIKMSKNAKKKDFFDINYLLKAKTGIILYILSLCTLVQVYSAERLPDAEIPVRAGLKTGADAQAPRRTGRPTGMKAEAEPDWMLEVVRLRRENQVLRGELLEIRKKLEKQNKDDLALRLWLTGVPAEGTVRKNGSREEQLLLSLGLVFRRGNELALKTAAFCDQVRELLREVPVGKVRQAEVRLKLDAASGAAQRMIGLTEYELSAKENAGDLNGCRILAVDPELSIVILSVGSARGAFPGLTCRTGKNGATRLRIVCVRPFVAAAAVLSGSIADLAPGMEAATEKRTSGERK